MQEKNKNTDPKPPRRPLSIHDEEISKALDEFIEAVKRSEQFPAPEPTRLPFPEAFEEIFSRTETLDDDIYNAGKWNVVTQLLDHYFNSGVYRFGDILDDVYTRFGKGIQPYFETMKVLYSIRFLDVTDEVAAQMEERLRSYTFEDLVRKNEVNPLHPSDRPKKKAKTQDPDQPRITRYSIAYYWIDYIRTYEKSYYKELKEDGTLRQTALEKEKQYYKDLAYLESKGLYPPGGAQEVARSYLYPKLYP